jgi:cholinesterase
MRGSVTIASWLFAATLSLAAPGRTFETVETGNGRIVGHRSASSEDVWEYLGIPYAQSPLGDLRFAAPQKYEGNGSYTANKFVSTCFYRNLPRHLTDAITGIVGVLVHIQPPHLTICSDCPQQAAVQPQFPGFTTQALRILSYFTAAAGTQRSEDCLTLNIWSKQTPKSLKADKPVFVLFYGGRQSPFALVMLPSLTSLIRFRWWQHQHPVLQRSTLRGG